jgi:ribosomal protein L11 methyltransferase
MSEDTKETQDTEDDLVSTVEPLWWRGEFMTTAPEVTAPVLWASGAQGVEVYDQETYFEEANWVPVPDGQTRLVAYFGLEREEQAPRLREVLEDICATSEEPLTLVELAAFTDTSWQDTWKAYFKPRMLCSRVLVGPPWEEFEAGDGAVKLIIEPGMAFGTGTHETTQLAAQHLDDALATNVEQSVLDVGCGSGILAIAAYLLGARHIEGVDHDPRAVTASRENLEFNSLPVDLIPFSTTPAGQVPGEWDIVIANILSHVLIKLSEALRARVRPGGILILSGILGEKIPELQAVFVTQGWSQVAVNHLGEWSSLCVRRDA